MRKLIFGVFAHPDDEAFGPCGTLIKEVRAGAELYLYSLTLGEAGCNPDNLPDLSVVREREWREAGRQIGATKLTSFGLGDGCLSNKDLQFVNKKLLDEITSIINLHNDPLEIEFITFELNGISGHIDHIVASRSASFVFYELKKQGFPVGSIRYFCLPEDIVDSVNTDWIFMNSGYSNDEISETVDASNYKDEIIKVMKIHHTQREDCKYHFDKRQNALSTNNFIVRS